MDTATSVLPSPPPARKRRRRWARAVGWLGCALAVGAAMWGIWFWMCRLQWVHEGLTEDFEPKGRNTPLEWEGIRERMRRGHFWSKDLIQIRYLGDTESLERIMMRILPQSGEIGRHEADALRALTAHDAGSTAEEWRNWWRTHQGKSQYTLIRESFAPLGLDPRTPPTKDQTLELLRLVGVGSRPTGAGPKPDIRPLDEARAINALRILRDREVKPEVVTHSDLLRPEGEAIFHGLVRYIRFRDRYPVHNGVGVVFGDHAGDIYRDPRDDPSHDDWEPWGFWGARWAPWAWFGGIAALLVIGAWGSRALWRSSRERQGT